MLKYIAALLMIPLPIGLLTHPSIAANCDTARREISNAASSTSIKVPEQKVVSAGGTITLGWRRGRVARLPIYLFLAFDKPVRFEGDGFYALLPNASAAFGIARSHDKTRAVVPYYGHGMQESGEVTVRPLQAGPLQVEWSVVGFDGCAEYLPERGHGTFQMNVEATGEPQIVVADELTGQAPRQRIYSPSGGRILDVHDGRYRLIETTSSAEIAERPGNTPRFSPTGRYVAAYAEDGVEIIDTVDGGLVFKNAIGFELAWDNVDSFATLNRGRWGSVTIASPSRKDAIVIEGGASCHGCNGIDNVALKVDLENNVAVYSGDQGAAAASLSSKAKAHPKFTDNSFGGSSEEVIGFVKRQSPAADFKLPKRWELHGGLKFSHLGPEGFEMGETTHQLKKFLVTPILELPKPVEEARIPKASTTQWRGIGVTASAAPTKGIFTRLEEFGVSIPLQARKPEAARFVHERKIFSADLPVGLTDRQASEVRVTARQIEREVQAARGAFVGDVTDGGLCQPHGSGAYAETQLYERFQRAFRFQKGERVIWITHQQCGEGSAAFHYPTAELFDTSTAAGWLIHESAKNPTDSPRDSCYANITFCAFEAEIFGDRYLVLSSRESRAIEIFDLNTRQNLFKKYELPRGDLLERALLSADNKSVVQINSDGTFAAFRFADAELLFEGRYVDDEVVIWTPDGRFDATAEGAHYVSLRLPGRAANYTFEQFTAQLMTPGLIAKRLAGERLSTAKLTSPPALSGTIEASRATLHIKAEATGDRPIASLLVYQDGLLTDRITGDGNNATWDLQISPLKGTRWVSIIALDRSGLASLPIGQAVTPSAPRRSHLLAIGIDTYSDARIPPLTLAHSDAKRFDDVLQKVTPEAVGAFRKMIADANATREGILAKLRDAIKAAEPGDTLVLFFAGHGLQSPSGEYFLATVDTNLDDIEGSALPWSAVAELLKQSRTRIAVFLDACHSGAADARRFATNDSAAQSLLEQVPSGIVVFSASKGREYSEESRAAGGGVFTSALINVLERARFDINGNGAIEISELYRGAKTQVKAMTGNSQTPWIARNQMIGDFSLF